MATPQTEQAPPKTKPRKRQGAIAKPGVPIGTTAHILAGICDAIDEGADPRGATLAAFNAAQLHHRDNIDAHVTFRRDAEHLILGAKEVIKRYRARIKLLEDILAADEAETRKALKAEPNIPWSGNVGAIKEKKNPPKLDLAIPVKASKSFNNLLDEETISLFDIDEEFIHTETVKSLRLKAVKDALKAGRELPWASIKHETRVDFTLQ